MNRREKPSTWTRSAKISSERDERDMNREISLLKQADDAVLVDSSEMGIDDVVNAILNVYKEKVQK